VVALKTLGITIPGRLVSEDPEVVGDVDERDVVGGLSSDEIVRKRRWSIEIRAQDAATAIAMRKLLEGEFHAALMTANTYSARGEGPKAGGTYTYSATGGAFSGGKVNVASTSFIEYALASSIRRDGKTWAPTQGWTLSVRKKIAGNYVHYMATGIVPVTRGAAANPPGVSQWENGAGGSFDIGHWIDVATDGDVGVYGYDDTGAGAAFDYDDIVVWPFAMPAAWANPIHDNYLTDFSHPRDLTCVLAGDQIEDQDNAIGGVLCKARVRRIPRAKRSGVPTARELVLDVREI
jgi:hypothetical protein